jgi:hypothetical protein
LSESDEVNRTALHVDLLKCFSELRRSAGGKASGNYAPIGDDNRYGAS